ncbi:MAG: hypothetical protein R3B90_00825 [Planctomycetaceae bacterium]
MQLEMHANVIRWNGLDGEIRQLVAQKFHRLRSCIGAIAVHLKDVNGPRGGNDADCLVRVSLQRLPDIVIRKRSHDLMDAVHTCLDRAVQSLVRVTGRRQRLRRRGGRKNADA